MAINTENVEEAVLVEMITKKELKELTSATNLLNGKKEDLMNKEFSFIKPDVNSSGFKSYIYEKAIDLDQRRINANALMYTPARKVGDNEAEYKALYLLLLEQMGKGDEVPIPVKFKITDVENAKYTTKEGKKVDRYPLHFYKEFADLMKEEDLTISQVYSRGTVNRAFFREANNWTILPEYSIDTDNAIKRVKIDIIS